MERRQSAGGKKTPASATTAQSSIKNGVFIFKDGSRYDGEYKDDIDNPIRQGVGKFTDKTTGCVYTGEWANDKMHGNGVMTYPSGAVYEGEWKEGKYEGKGSYKWTNGTTYVGEWIGNRMHGGGQYVDPTGQVWVGQFFKGTGNALYPELA